MFEVQQIFQGQYKDTNIPLKRLLIYYFPSADLFFFIAAVGISNSYQVGGFFTFPFCHSHSIGYLIPVLN